VKEDHVEERRRMISDAFHTLNQPLTGLHCGLEIVLQKPRNDGEYRQRIGEGIEHAGQILQLVRAIRALVDAADPGERFGTVDLSSVLSQVKNEVDLVAEARQVALEVSSHPGVRVNADPGKMTAALGGLVAAQIDVSHAGTPVRLVSKTGKKAAVLTVRGSSDLYTPEANGKVDEIRHNAACSYLWTIGGKFERLSDGIKITLPVAKAPLGSD